MNISLQEKCRESIARQTEIFTGYVDGKLTRFILKFSPEKDCVEKVKIA